MNEMNINEELSVIVIPDTVLLHETTMNLKIGKKIGGEIYNRVVNDDGYGIVLASKEDSRGIYAESDFYKVGTLVKIVNAREQKDFYQLRVEIMERVKIKDFIPEGRNYRATYELKPDINDLDEENQKETLKHIRYLVAEISQNFKGSKPYVDKVNHMDDLTQAIAYIFPHMRLSLEEKQNLLEIRSLADKSLKFLDILIEQKDSIKFQMEMAAKFNEEINKKHRENLLKEQLRAIQDELSESEGTSPKKDYRELIEAANMPEEVKEVALEEVNKLDRQGPHSSEENVIRNYLDLLVSLPWGESEIKDIDIEAARKILNDEHYGLDKVKDRI
ncbi:LON peptidase substrate-binding domain-containing protein, partial [Methanobacterium alcaliphilum]|uniref:LON peptidase substrate-binding domain-containing protein n=1 Tax=Methanobacterium alcaliphilum TaxID=392018 RepID=UPI002009DCBF